MGQQQPISADKRSIASITKVMTATVFVESDPDMSQKVTVDRADVRAASTTYLRANDVITVGDLLHLLLIASDNAAARVLARVSPWGSGGFVVRMNEKAAELGMEASFAKPFCAMLPDPAKPNISAFLKEAGIGEPVIDVTLQKSREGKEHILAANVVRTAPCGSRRSGPRRGRCTCRPRPGGLRRSPGCPLER